VLKESLVLRNPLLRQAPKRYEKRNGYERKKNSRIYNMKKSILLIASIFIAIYAYNNFFTNNTLIGTYVNRNYENDFIGGNPHIVDTLILKKDNQFESPYYGKGTYKLSYGLGGTRIELHYGDGYSSANINGEKVIVPNEESFETSIDRIWFIGNPQISLFEDLNQYYEKIE
jgi:hypothetical protein